MWWTAALPCWTSVPATAGAQEEPRLPVTLHAPPLGAPVRLVVPIVVPTDRLDPAVVERRAVAVVSSDGEPLPFEIEGWGDPLGATLWVDPGPVLPGVDRTVWVEWRSSGRDHPDAVPLEWPAPWVGVWHLDGCGARCPSSVPGAGDAELAGAPADDGRFARGRRLDGAGSVQIPLGVAADADRFVAYAWSWSDDALPGRTLANVAGVGLVRCAEAATFRFEQTGQTMCSVPAVLDVGRWQLLTVEVDGRRGGVTFRPGLDGQPLFPLALDEPLGTARAPTLTVGPRHGVSVEGPGALAFVGRVDEIRLAAEPIPASVLLAEHHFATGGVTIGAGPEPEPTTPDETADTATSPGTRVRSSSRLVAGRCDAAGAGPSAPPIGLVLLVLAVWRRRRWGLAGLYTSTVAAAASPAEDVRLPVTVDARTLGAPVHVAVPIVVPPDAGLEAGREPIAVAVLDEGDQPLPFEVEGWGDAQGTTLWVDPGPVDVGEIRTLWVVWTRDGAAHPAHVPLVWPDVWDGVWHFDRCPDAEVCRPAHGVGQLDVEGAPTDGRFGRGWAIATGDRVRLALDGGPPTPLTVSAWMWSDDVEDRLLVNADVVRLQRCDGAGIRLGAGARLSPGCFDVPLRVGAWQLVTVEVTGGALGRYDATVDLGVATYEDVLVVASGSPRLELGPGTPSMAPFLGRVDELRVAYGAVPREVRLGELVLANHVTVGVPGGVPPEPGADTGLAGAPGGVWRRARAGRCDASGAGWGGWAAVAAALASGRRRRCG